MNRNFDGILLFHRTNPAGDLTIASLIASPFNEFAQENLGMFKGLNYLIVGGEAVSDRHFQLVLNSSAGTPRYLVTAYGPTENTTFTTTCLVHENQPSAQNKPN